MCRGGAGRPVVSVFLQIVFIYNRIMRKGEWKSRAAARQGPRLIWITSSLPFLNPTRSPSGALVLEERTGSQRATAKARIVWKVNKIYANLIWIILAQQ